MSAKAAVRDFAFAVAVGPVSRFIGGGRRSRDLWYGSRFLSEATAAAGRHLRSTKGVTIVVPIPVRLDRKFLRSHEGPVISNKIIGFQRGATADDVRAHLATAHDAARGFLVEQLQELREDRRCDGLVVPSRVEAAIEAVQRGDFIEFYAAFAPIQNGDEQDALKRAFALLSARKNTRAFGAPPALEGVPKSWLDPGRDTVLDEADPRIARGKALLLKRRRLGIEGQERLDAVSVARRRSIFVHTTTGAELPRLPFPPLARVVVAPWLAGAARTSRHHLEIIRKELDGLWNEAPDALCLFSSPCREPGSGAGDRLFDYDPSLFFENGIEALRRAVEPTHRVGQLFPAAMDAGERPKEDATVSRVVARAMEALDRIAPTVRELHARLGMPQLYYALLEADGDGIGTRLEKASPAERDALVAALYDFADEAWDIVGAHDGCAFYIGADELTAYLPVDRALDAAVKLMALLRTKLASKGQGDASLSVGVAIAHVKDDLRATRREARKALDHAKTKRREKGSQHGWLCVREVPRGGSIRIAVGEIPLGDDHRAGGFYRDVKRWGTALAEGLLSTSTAHDLLALADRFERRNTAVGLDLARGIFAQKPERSGAAERRGGGDLATLLKTRGDSWRSWTDVRDFAHEVLLAERIRRVLAQRRDDAEVRR